MITLDYTATASDFIGPSPVSPAIVSFTLTFDNSADISETSAGLTINSANFAYAPTVVFSYIANADLIEIGANSELNQGAATDDFLIDIAAASSNPSLDYFAISSTTTAGIVFAASLSLTPNTVSEVPEPASLALLGMALAGVGAMRGRRSRTSV